MKIPFIVAILITTYSAQADDVDKEARRASKFTNLCYCFAKNFIIIQVHTSDSTCTYATM
jgi:hypothetical protein